MAAAFNLYQQVFTLSAMSNWENKPADEGMTVAELESGLTAAIDSALADSQIQGLIGVWQRVWGPVIFQNESSGVADNAMYVALGEDDNGKPVYVVAIAGTNPASAYAQKNEDLDVSALAPLPSDPGGTNLISLGTFNGAARLEAMVYSNAAAGTGAPSLSLVEYLNGLGTGGTLIFTGHSLGGALAPALAVDLVRYGGLQTANFSDVYVYPTAGPTPGTSGFASLFQETFPLVSTGTNTYQSWNGLVWNSLDVVPHAWAQVLVQPLPPGEGRLGQIPTLYEPAIPSSPCIQNLVTDAEGLAALTLVEYRQIQTTGALPGALNSSLPPTGDPACDFVQQAYYQHIAAYFDLLGVSELLTTEFFGPTPLPSGFCSAFKQKCCSSPATP